MSDWKVSKQKIELFNHSNADSLELGKVGSYQVVVQKGLYKNGDEVVFAPEKSILSGKIREEFENYLVGSDKNRVKAVRLRGEFSSGIIIPTHLVGDLDDYELGVDISDKLGIEKYVPSIPTQLRGSVKPFEMDKLGSHDCEQVGVYLNQLIQGERVVITEKVHGCCDEDTLLDTEDGIKTIKEICDTKYTGGVLSYSIDQQIIEYDYVVNHDVKKNINNWFLLELDDGSEIKLTDNHRVYLPELDCYRQVKDINEGDYFLLKK